MRKSRKRVSRRRISRKRVSRRRISRKRVSRRRKSRKRVSRRRVSSAALTRKKQSVLNWRRNLKYKMDDFSQLQKSFPEDMTEHKKITARMAWDSAGLDENQSTLVREDMESRGPIMSLDNFFSRFNTALDKLYPSPHPVTGAASASAAPQSALVG